MVVLMVKGLPTGCPSINFTISGDIANILYDSSTTDQLTLVLVIISDWD
jgi:hypothetical protein